MLENFYVNILEYLLTEISFMILVSASCDLNLTEQGFSLLKFMNNQSLIIKIIADRLESFVSLFFTLIA